LAFSQSTIVLENDTTGFPFVYSIEFSSVSLLQEPSDDEVSQEEQKDFELREKAEHPPV
jgi:hypothetical protein